MDKIYPHLLLIPLLITYSTTFELKPADSKELLVLNEVQDIYTFCRHHTLQYEVDFKGIAEINNKLTEAIALLNELCNNVHLNYICSHMIKEINTLYENMQQQNRIIKVSKIPSSEQKIGPILNTLEKTVVLADTTYYNLKQSIERMQSVINFLTKYQNKIQHQFEYNLQFDQLAQLTTINLKKCISLLQSMIEIFVHKNFKHITDVIPTDIIKKDITQIMQKSGNESCKIPIHAKGTYVHEILRASEIKTFETAFSYAIEIKIPTTNQHSFKLVQAIPIPFTYKNETFELDTLHDYYTVEHQKLPRVRTMRD